MLQNRVFILGLLVMLVLVSCSEQQDFDQYKQLQVRPTIESGLVYVEVPEYFINAAFVANVVTDEYEFELFADDYFVERVLDGVITYEIENTTSKDITATLELLDQNGAVLDFEIFQINEAPSADLVRETHYGPGGKSIEIIKNLALVRVTVTNEGDQLSISDLPEPKIKIRSKGEFTIRVR